MKIELWPVTRPIPYGRNPRENAAAIDRVAASLKEFGWQQPIVVDSNDVIVVGHTRLLAAQKLGLSEVPVHIAANLTPTQAKAYRITDNKTSEFAEWNSSLLALEFEDLQLEGFDLSLTGFVDSEIGKLLAENEPSEAVAPEAFKEFDENIETDHTCPKCGYRFSGGGGSSD